MIQVSDLYKSFGDKQVLKGVTMTIPAGSTTCIIGKSGCGKSVLLKNIVGLLTPDRGEVSVDGKIISALNGKEIFGLRKSMGFVFQGAALFDSLSVYENVIISLYEHGMRENGSLQIEAMKALSSVAMLPDYTESETKEYQKEWELLKDKKPSDLSGGMKKRVGVARALVGNPKYIFYDEPTTGLDPVTSEQIDNLIGDLSKKLNVTSIVITHDMFSVYRVGDSVAMLNDGQVWFEGRPGELERSDDPVVLEFLERYRK